MQMVHYHNGLEYRGVTLWEWFFKYKNPRYGEGYGVLVKDPAAIYGKNKSHYTTRVKARRTYVKPPTEEQWVNMLNPPVDSTSLTKTDEKKEIVDNKPKKENKKKKAVDNESSGIKETSSDSTKNK